jgi:hypothetical protein
MCLAALSACKRTAASPGVEEPAAPSVSTRAPDPSTDLAYVCPMDPDIRSNGPGKCPRCGMALVAGIPDPVEFHLDLDTTPKPLRANEQARLAFEVFDPWKSNPVRKFNLVHEKLFHAFVVSRDLDFFLHGHPVWDNDRTFNLDVTLPKPGMYRVLGDFYPEAATPQLLNTTLFVPGGDMPAPHLTADYSTKHAENLDVSLSVLPSEPLAGITTQLRFTLSPVDGLEKYLGVWAHMLIASDDLIDMMHEHPFLADGSPEMQFKLIFPRPGGYRIWAQFQRNGVVNTVHFDVAVTAVS